MKTIVSRLPLLALLALLLSASTALRAEDQSASAAVDSLYAGERFFEGINLPDLGYACTQRVASPRATHIVLTRT